MIQLIVRHFSVRVINASVDEACASCIKRNGICLDENADDRMEQCFCPTDNDLCNERPSTTTTTYFVPMTQPLRKKYECFYIQCEIVDRRRKYFR